MSEWRVDFDSQEEPGWRAQQDELRNITAESLARISEAAKKQRAQKAIQKTLEALPRIAQAGSRRWHVGSNHPDVIAYFEERGFSVSEVDLEHDICISW